MTLDHAPSAYGTPVQWAADWLTPDEARGLRATERMEALRPRHTAPAPRKALHASHSARQKRIRARRVQLLAQTVTYLAIATLFVVACGFAIRVAVALYGH